MLGQMTAKKLNPLIRLDSLKEVVKKLVAVPKSEIDQMELERPKKAKRKRPNP